MFRHRTSPSPAQPPAFPCAQDCATSFPQTRQSRAAPAVLGKLGILEGKQATCYPGFQEALGESYVGGLVVESKNVITAKGPGLSSDFAFCLIERLVGSEAADAVYDAAQY